MQPIMSSATVSAVRGGLISRGFAPVPLYSHTDLTLPESHRGKRPCGGNGWQHKAQADLSTGEIDDTPGETGIDCTGLRVPDIDIDDPTVASAVTTLAKAVLGDAPMRYRDNSPRVALIYRAADPSARKRILKGALLNQDGRPAKIEILGCGQQLASFGHHATGAMLQWDRDLPPACELITLTEEQIDRFFLACAPLLGASVEPERPATVSVSSPRPFSGSSPEYPPLTIEDIASALDQIQGGHDYDYWLLIGSAIYAATDGSADGLALWHAWSAQWNNYDTPECDRRWRHRRLLPQITAGRLVHEARRHRPDWLSPSVRASRAERERERERAQDEVDDDDYGFPMYSPNQLRELPEPVWMIFNMLAENSLAVVYGPPKSLKTFAILDICFRLAHGMDLDGSPQPPRNIYYVTGEGQGALFKRYQGWTQTHGLPVNDIPPITFVTKIVNLLDEGSVEKFIAALRQRERKRGSKQIDVIVLDTLSRAMAGGAENASEIMTKAIASAESIGQEFGALVIVVHHTGKDSDKGARGHSSLDGAVYSAIEVVRDRDTETVTVEVKRLKDGEEGLTLAYHAEIVDVGPHPLYPTDQPRSTVVLQRLPPGEGMPLVAKATDARAVMTRRRIADAMEPGESPRVTAVARLIGLKKGGTANDRVREVLADGELYSVGCKHGTVILGRRVEGAEEWVKAMQPSSI